MFLTFSIRSLKMFLIWYLTKSIISAEIVLLARMNKDIINKTW